MSNRVICSKISVDCIKNDPVDIKAGGAEILGYDFFVEEKAADKLVEIVKATIKELNLPLMGINILDVGKLSLASEHVWTAPRIVQCIIDESDVIISEAKRQKIYKK